jgi:hypothetical protein
MITINNSSRGSETVASYNKQPSCAKRSRWPRGINRRNIALHLSRLFVGEPSFVKKVARRLSIERHGYVRNIHFGRKLFASDWFGRAFPAVFIRRLDTLSSSTGLAFKDRGELGDGVPNKPPAMAPPILQLLVCFRHSSGAAALRRLATWLPRAGCSPTVRSSAREGKSNRKG